MAGEFEKWQSWQSKKNFERKYIISLLQLPGDNKWLFAGGFVSEGNKYIKDEKNYKYKTTEVNQFASLAGKLVISFKRSGRQSYLNAENWASDLLVNELKPDRMAVEEFGNSPTDRKELSFLEKQMVQSKDFPFASLAE